MVDAILALFLILLVCAGLFWLVDNIGLGGRVPVIMKTLVAVLGFIAILVKFGGVLKI